MIVIATAVAVVVLVAAVLWMQHRLFRAAINAAYYRGLYEGERARREATERWLTYRSPIEPKARAVTAEKSSEEQAEALGAPEFSDETIERGMRDLGALYAEAGVKIDEATLRKEVVEMLAQSPDFVED